MIELLFFLLGLGFSIVVYVRSIHHRDHPAHKKLLYFMLTTIGITGFLLLFGVMVVHAIKSLSSSL